ncbi:MAG: FHA domain-containing protein, partial [Anaerolineae bacterium]|nr:FHA domain-containing protein [Anaerolineae bacterium]
THEWAFALGLGLRVIPIIVRFTPLHPRLSILKPLDFTENPIPEAKWTQLTDWLKKLQQEQDTKTHASIENTPFISPNNLSGAWIIQTKGPNQGKSWHLDKPVMIVGRDVGNDIFIDNRSVSRRHAMISQTEDGTYVFEDLSSTNGSVVNGKRIIEPLVLNNGDILHLGGEVSLRFHSTG